jgi:hypothetical protein
VKCTTFAADNISGDGMTTNMITAARLLAHKTINGKYQSLLALDKFPVLGHQMVCLAMELTFAALS